MKQIILNALILLACCLCFTECKKENLAEKPDKTNLTPADSSENSEDPDKKEEEEEKQDDTPLTNESELFYKLTNGVLQGAKEINVREFNIPTEKADSIYSSFLRNNPLLFHLKVVGNSGYRMDLENPEYLATFIPQYSVSPTSFHQIYPLLEEAIEQFYSLLDYRMTPAEIAYTLYQKICKEVIYGERNEEYPHWAYSAFSALGVFLPHKAVCQGYSLSYSLLLNGLGIKTNYVTGAIAGTPGHAWNRVYIDGEWYNADATFDDASNNNFTTKSCINKYFLCSDDLFYTTFEHAKPHLNLDEQIYKKSGNKFDNEKCAIRGYNKKGEVIKTEAIYADGYWYYLSLKDEKMKIIKSDFNGQHITELKQQNIFSKTGNVDKVQYTKDRIFFLDIIDNKYYICSIDYDGNDFRQEQQISFTEAADKDLKLTHDESHPVHVFKGTVALKAELMLARLKLLYCHGDEDYFNLSNPQSKEVEKLIKDAEILLENHPKDDVQADILAQKIRNARKAYNQPVSMKP